MSDILILHLKKEFYDAIESGHKKVEYRELSPYWLTRITYEKKFVHFFLGYPPKGIPPLIKKIYRVNFNIMTNQIEIYLEDPD